MFVDLNEWKNNLVKNNKVDVIFFLLLPLFILFQGLFFFWARLCFRHQKCLFSMFFWLGILYWKLQSSLILENSDPSKFWKRDSLIILLIGVSIYFTTPVTTKCILILSTQYKMPPSQWDFSRYPMQNCSFIHIWQFYRNIFEFRFTSPNGLWVTWGWDAAC